MSTETPKGYVDLTPQQRMKCNWFMQYFNELDSVRLTLSIKGSGEKSLRGVKTKILLLVNASDEQRKYDDALYGAFSVQVDIPPGLLVHTVLKVRGKLKLPLYTTSMEKACIADLKRLFMVDETMMEVPTEKKDGSKSTKKVVAHYTPTFKLRPEAEEADAEDALTVETSKQQTS